MTWWAVWNGATNGVKVNRHASVCIHVLSVDERDLSQKEIVVSTALTYNRVRDSTVGKRS